MENACDLLVTFFFTNFVKYPCENLEGGATADAVVKEQCLLSFLFAQGGLSLA